MASICDDGGGLKRILFVAGDGRRKAIRLGKQDRKGAEGFRLRVEKMIGAGIVGSTPDDETHRWIAGLDDKMHGRLAAVGLVKPRAHSAATLEGFLDDYFAGLSVKAGTATAYGHTRRCLLDFFGESKPLRDIEPADADKWRQWLKTANLWNKQDVLSESTISRRVGVARMVFRRALKWKLIRENPFADVKAGSQSNKARMYFVTREDTQKVLDKCPDAQWKLLFALSRFGGLRCPSEHLALTWADVDWEHGRIRVPSPKTEHHEGMDCRYIPLFPELRPYLLDVFEQAEPGTKYVITRYRAANANLRTQLHRIISKAGLTPWPKLFHNLRSTRQTELAERYPIHVVCAWIGNSRAVAQEHYLQVTDSHFAEASKEPVPTDANKAAQNQAQQAAEPTRTEQSEVHGNNENRPGIPGDCNLSHDIRRDWVGLSGEKRRQDPINSEVTAWGGAGRID